MNLLCFSSQRLILGSHVIFPIYVYRHFNFTQKMDINVAAISLSNMWTVVLNITTFILKYNWTFCSPKKFKWPKIGQLKFKYQITVLKNCSKMSPFRLKLPQSVFRFFTIFFNFSLDFFSHFLKIRQFSEFLNTWVT